jgi:hypothetical protein
MSAQCISTKQTQWRVKKEEQCKTFKNEPLLLDEVVDVTVEAERMKRRRRLVLQATKSRMR